VPAGRGHDGYDIYFAAVQMSRMPMCLADPHQNDCPLVFVNRAFCELTGYEPQEILGRNCRFLQGPKTSQAELQRVRTAIERREDVHVDLFNYRKDGSAFWNALFLSPVFDSDGELVYFFGSQLDVTKRREAEAVLAQSQRMETLGSMASGMAHEFNNLMTVVIASLEQAARRPSSERQGQQLDRALWGARRAGRLTQQMLSFARRQFHDDRPFDLNDVVSGLDQILRQVAGGHVNLAFDLAADPVPARLDAGQLELSLINLIRNAADATPPGGTIVVATRVEPGRADRPRVVVSVRDNGHGMSAEVVSRSVEPFFTTKAPGHGTGLGLSMVKGFAEQSSGTLEIESIPGQGTTVTLGFPLYDADAPVDEEAPYPPARNEVGYAQA
jgi:PAS domain S-box-containing protein